MFRTGFVDALKSWRVHFRDTEQYVDGSRESLGSSNAQIVALQL